MTGNEAVLLWLLGFLSLMAAWCVAEWLFLRIARDWRARRWQRRLRAFDARADRSRYALRHTVRPW
jgi:hypothetical protein